MDRLDGARRVQRWKLSMKSLLCSICNVSVVRRRKNPRWENMDRDILAKIFEKLNVIDIIMGVSNVCVSWFLVSHQKSLWKTINLANIQLVDLDHPRLQPVPIEGLEARGCIYHPRKILIEITKFCSTVPTSLFFNFYSYIEDEDLILAAERMPNISKVVLPRWCSIIIYPVYFSRNERINFRVVGENCTNLTNLKISGHVNAYMAKEIVCYLPKLKRLSMRRSVIINTEEVLSLINTCLQNLATLNLSHCIFKDNSIFGTVLENSFIKTATQKIDAVIMCANCVSCGICQDRCHECDVFSFCEKHWRDDEIKEFEF